MKAIDHFDDYQTKANGFINQPRYPPLDTERGLLEYLNNVALGITGEGGEVADWVKKLRYHGLPLSDEVVNQVKKELGDVLWYIAMACLALDCSMSEIATANIEKLRARHGEKFNEDRANVKDFAKLKNVETNS